MRRVKAYESIESIDEQIGELEDARLQAENPEFRNLLIEYREGILLFSIMEKEVWNRGSEDSVGLRKTYEKNQSKYQAGDRVRARIFSAANKNVLESFRKKVMTGDSIKKTDLKGLKSMQPMRNYEKGDSKVMDKVAWAVGLHDVQMDETYYLVEIHSLIPPGIKSFEEARAQAVADYQETLEKNWLDELKLKYPVKVNNKSRKYIVNELTKK